MNKFMRTFLFRLLETKNFSRLLGKTIFRSVKFQVKIIFIRLYNIKSTLQHF
jgi:hypothetical protein